MTTHSKLLALLLGLLAAPALLWAQPQPCGPNAAMTSTCAQACIICDIDGFTGINNSSVQGQAPPGFCTTQVHHMQWIAFIAGSTNLTLRVTVFNCQGNDGLEVGIYQSNNCSTFTPVVNCNTDIQENSSALFTNIVPLVVGQYYYFVMDGSNNDICNYTIDVISGSTLVSPLTTSGQINGDDQLCPGQEASFSAAPVDGATIFLWTLDGQSIGVGEQIERNFPQVGTYQLCLTAANACDQAEPVCRTITVAPIPPTELEAYICPGECVTYNNQVLCQAGDYSFTFTSADGCDSTVVLHVDQPPPYLTEIDLNICEGDTVYIGSTPFDQTGEYMLALPAADGCDSAIHLQLMTIVCEIQAHINAQQVTCRDDRDGSISFAVDNGTPPFNYTWERIGYPAPSGTGTLSQNGQTINLNGLPAGGYVVSITDNFGNDVVLITEVINPPLLELSLSASDYHGFGVSCAGAADGSINSLAAGGLRPYQYQWSQGNPSPSLGQLAAGQYSLSLTDAAGCRVEATQAITQPEPLSLAATFVNPGCDGMNSGSIAITNSSGGVPPYQYALNTDPWGSVDSWPQLPEGNYRLGLQDANGCYWYLDTFLRGFILPVIELGNDQIIELGQQVPIRVSTNLPLQQISWTPTDWLSCADCLEPSTMPLQRITYTLNASSADGCPASDSITFYVVKNRDVYAPNAFSPNADGVNDYFNLFGGPQLRLIRRLKVFSRWGELIYDGQQIEPNGLSAGWNGRFRGQPMPEGVYVWWAELEFIDDETIIIEGSVSLVR